MVELSLPVVSWDYFANTESFPSGMAWPREDSGRFIEDWKSLYLPAIFRRPMNCERHLVIGAERAAGAQRYKPPSDGRYFEGVVALDFGDWSYRIEPGMVDKPGTLSLTPTAAAVKEVREALAEIDRERDALEKTQAEATKATAEAEQAKSAAAPDAEKKYSVESDSK